MCYIVLRDKSSTVIYNVSQFNDMQSFLKYKPSLLVAVPSEAGAQVECFSFHSSAPQLDLSPVEYVAGPVSNHLVKNTLMVRVTGSVPLFLTSNTNGNVMMKDVQIKG